MDIETKQEYANFDGVQLSATRSKFYSDFESYHCLEGDSTCTHVKEISNSSLLVSLHYNYLKSANMEIFDISKKGEAKKIYSLGEVSGSNY